MGKTALMTGWVRIGRSGSTADGRTIDGYKVTEAAESYDPELYTAVINYEHYRYYGNYGKVLELRAIEDGDVVYLEARLEPNKHFIQLNADGQKLFTSMELTPNFDNTGKHYLSGLALTDSPASLGTSEIKFNKQTVTVERGDSEEISAESFALSEGDNSPAPNEQFSAEEKTFMEKAVHFFRLSKNSPKETTNPKDDDAMNAEQFAKFEEGQQALISAVNGLSEKFTAQPQTPEATGEEASAPDTITAEQFASLKEGQDALTESLKELSDKFSKLEEPTPGSVVPPNEGDSAINPEFV